MPRLRHQLTQATHNLVALVVGDIAVIELLQAAIHLDQLVDQRAAGDLGRVRRQHQLQRQRLDGGANGAFADVGLLFKAIEGGFQQFGVICAVAAA